MKLSVLTVLVISVLLLSGLITIGHSQPPAAGADSGLYGSWQIVTLIDDGVLIPPSAISEQFVKDSRLTISGSTITIIRPGQSEPRQLPYVVENTTTPKSLDIAGTTKIGSKGIYLYDKETLIVCLSGPNSMERPREFASVPGSGQVLMILRRVNDKPPAANDTATIPLSNPIPPTAVPPSSPNQDRLYQELLVGTWGYQTDDVVVYSTLNSDGTFASMQTWKKGFRRMFHEDVRNSGTWKVEDGSLVVRVTASTDPRQRNQLFVTKIASLDGREAVFIDPDGRTRREWKVR